LLTTDTELITITAPAMTGFTMDTVRDGIGPHGVLLYTLARSSLQSEVSRLAALSAQQMESFAMRIRALGVSIKVAA
jgi:hypothetical protein